MNPLSTRLGAVLTELRAQERDLEAMRATAQNIVDSLADENETTCVLREQAGIALARMVLAAVGSDAPKLRAVR